MAIGGSCTARLSPVNGLPEAPAAGATISTTRGGLSSVPLSKFLGFRVTKVIALVIYAAAFAMFAVMRKHMGPAAGQQTATAVRPPSGPKRSLAPDRPTAHKNAVGCKGISARPSTAPQVIYAA